MQHVIITGTTRGLGLAMCLLYLEVGHKVTGFARSPTPQVLQKFEDVGQYKHILADLSDLKNVDAVQSEFLDKRTAMVIINAADYSSTTNTDILTKQLNLNLLFPILLIQKLNERNIGYQSKVIFVSSIMAEIYDQNNPAYGAAKAAVSHFIDGKRGSPSGGISFLKVIAGPMYDIGTRSSIRKFVSLPYTVAAGLILSCAKGKDNEIFIPGIWRYIIWLMRVFGKKRSSKILNSLR